MKVSAGETHHVPVQYIHFRYRNRVYQSFNAFHGEEMTTGIDQ
jgi:hypothetical protein